MSANLSVCFRVKELEAAAPVTDNRSADVVPVAAPNDTPLRKQSSDLAVLRTTNVSDYIIVKIRDPSNNQNKPACSVSPFSCLSHSSGAFSLISSLP